MLPRQQTKNENFLCVNKRLLIANPLIAHQKSAAQKQQNIHAHKKISKVNDVFPEIEHPYTHNFLIKNDFFTN